MARENSHPNRLLTELTTQQSKSCRRMASETEIQQLVRNLNLTESTIPTFCLVAFVFLVFLSFLLPKVKEQKGKPQELNGQPNY